MNEKPFDNNGTLVTTELVANKTVAQITALANAVNDTPTLYADDDVIEAYVSSSDETGNFFTTICMQTIPTSTVPAVGFSVSADFKSFGFGFTPGRKVYIKLKGLYYAKVDGSLKIGSIFDDNGTPAVGRIAPFDWDKHLFPSATIVSEDTLVSTETVATLNNDSNLNVLTDLQNVQFSDGALSRTLYDVDSGGGATNHIINGVGTTNISVLRTSKFATLARFLVPAGRGTIRGVLTKFGTTFQFYIRNTSDLRLTQMRSYNFVSTLNEGFQSAANNQKIFANYLNFATLGTKDWIVKTGNWLEMSAFAGNVESNKTYFLVPVNMTAANNFSFQVRIQFFALRSGLKVYRTMDYVPGMKISDATLFDISGSFSIPSASASGTTPSFSNAGTYTIPTSVEGNGFFVFEYTGSNITSRPIVTTTVQIDDIVIN